MPRLSKSLAKHLGVVVAERELCHLDGRAVMVRIGAPRPWGRDWECCYAITGGGQNVLSRACGVDSVQALHLALVGIRGTLTSRAIKGQIYSFDVDDAGGFPLWVPDSYGPQLVERVERLIDGAALKLAIRAEAKKSPRSARTKTVTIALSPRTAAAARSLSKASGRTVNRVVTDLLEDIVQGDE